MVVIASILSHLRALSFGKLDWVNISEMGEGFIGWRQPLQLYVGSCYPLHPVKNTKDYVDPIQRLVYAQVH
jgi:hypothetical protein